MLENRTHAEGVRRDGRIAAAFRRLGARRQILVIVHDVAIATLSLPIAYLLRDAELLLSPRGLDFVPTALPIMALAALIAMLTFASHRAVWRYMGVPEIVRLSQFALLAVLLFCLGQFLIDRLQDLPRAVPPLQFLVMMFLMLASRIGYGAVLRRTAALSTATMTKPILLIGSGDGTALFIRMLGFRRHLELEPVGILCDQVATNRSIAGIPVLGDLADFDRVVAKLEIQGMAPALIVITRPHHELGRSSEEGYAIAEALLERADAAGIDVADLPDLMRFKDEAPATALRRDDLAVDVYPGLKRAFDVLISLLVLVFLSPLIALTAAVVAVFIQRPLLFLQRRPGLGRKPFKLYKFRTMRDPVDAYGRVLTDAERTPRAGRVLRRTRVDELPQFWNVLIGDMAIIGPRPLIRADLDAMPDRGEARCRTKPGITGWAQVNGGHQLAAREKQALDAWYAQNASLLLDLRIVWRTLAMMLMGERRDENAIAMAMDEATSPLGVAAE